MNNLKEEDFVNSAKIIGCEVAVVKAVAEVESAGGGFNPDGTVKTLFEGHIFHKYTNGKFDKLYPSLSYPTWTKIYYGKTWQLEKARFEQALKLDRKAALLSTSYGIFQICGFNYTNCYYTDIEEFYKAMCSGEGKQLELFCKFIIKSGLGDELKDKRWVDFARLYNGREYAKNQYDIKLASAYNKFKK